MGRSLQGKEEEEHFMQGEQHVQKPKVDKSPDDSGHRGEFRVVRIWGSQEEMKRDQPGRAGWGQPVKSLVCSCQ